MKWVTRERPKIDRLACPWLIRRFIDPEAEMHYVPAAHVLPVAGSEGAIPFDVPEVELTHSGPMCIFVAFLVKYHLEDAALARLVEIVLAALPLLKRFGLPTAARASCYLYTQTSELDRLATAFVN